MRTAVIWNPVAAGGKGRRLWPRIAARLSERIGPFEAESTSAAGDGAQLARAFAERGFERVVAVGGDGTFSDVAGGLLEGRTGASLGLVPVATAGDLPRTLGIGADFAAAVDIVAQGLVKAIDAGRVTFTDNAGAVRTRHFVNIVSLGLGGEVARRVRASSLPFGGPARYLFYAALALLGGRAAPVTLVVDGRRLAPLILTHAAIGNGRYHGGGMHVCPLAEIDDGVFDVTAIRRVGLHELLRNLALVYNGAIYTHPKVDRLRCMRICVTSESEVPVEIDGEPLGRLPLEVEIMPKALRVLVPPD